MIPILYEKNETAFTSNGICRLPDMISGTVTEELNGVFIVEFEYPVDGAFFSEIKIGRIIFCSCSRNNRQPFEIYESSKPINGRVIFYARHLTYRANFIPVKPCRGDYLSATDALNLLKTNSMIECDFTVESNISTPHTYEQTEVAPFRGRLGGVEGSILDIWGGEYEWDYDFTNQCPKIKLWAHRGQETGVQIRYGKNLTDLKQDESIENMITGVVLYYKNETECIYSEVVQRNVGGQYTAMPRIGIVDVSSNYSEEPPTQEILTDAAEEYLDSHNIGVPEVSINVSFVNLADTEEYKNVAVLERVQICDTVTVIFEKLGVSATAKIIRIVWNFLNDRYDSIELGNSRTNISSVIVEQESTIKNEVPSMVDMQSAIDNATKQITGNNGGYVVIKENQYGKPEEILIMDTDDIDTAVNVWRWNLGGLGHSSDGYDPDAFDVAITQDGKIVADFITAGEMHGDRIKAHTMDADRIGVGVLVSKNSLGQSVNEINMETGAFKLAGGNLEYVADTAFIKLKNNLSLQLNNIPLAGKHYHYRWNNGVISGDTLTWNSATLSGHNVDIEIDLVAMPYMTLIGLKIGIKANDAALAGFVASGFPTEAHPSRFNNMIPLGETLNQANAIANMQGDSSYPTGNLYLAGIASSAYLDRTFGGSGVYYTGS